MKRTSKLLSWIDHHPRLGWYIAVLAAAERADVLLNLLDLFK